MKIIEKIKTLSAGTIIRTIFQFLAYINQVVALLGQYNFFGFADNKVYQIVSLVLTIVVTAFSYWYTNDWTKAAQLADEVYNIVKDGKVTKEEVTEFVDKHRSTEKEANDDNKS